MRRRIILALAGVALVLVAFGGIFLALQGCAAATAPVGLTGHPWKLTRLVVDGRNHPFTQDYPPTLNFQPRDHTISGFSGCNSYNGSYTLMGSSLHFDHMQTTLMACLDSVMEREFAYMEALSRVGNYHIEGDILTLEGDGGRVIMTFQPGNASPG